MKLIGKKGGSATQNVKTYRRVTIQYILRNMVGDGALGFIVSWDNCVNYIRAPYSKFTSSCLFSM